MIAHAPIINGIQLSEIADEDHGNVSEGEVIRIEVGIAEEAPFGLLSAEVNACEEGTTNERDFVNDEEGYRPPLFFKAPGSVASEPFCQAPLPEMPKLEQQVFAPKPMLKAATPV